MSFVNKKIGNGFLMNAVDSTKDQEHYFGGARKHLEMFIAGLSGNAETVDAIGNLGWDSDNEILYLTSSFGTTTADAIVSGSFLFDENLVSMNNKYDFLKESFENVDLSTEKFAQGFQLEMSHSFETPSGNPDPLIFFEDKNSNEWLSFPISEINGQGSFLDLGKTDPGWKRFQFKFSKNNLPVFSLALISSSLVSEVAWKVSLFTDFSGSIWAFRNFKLSFLEKLSDNGVQKLKELDNQHTEKITTFLNRDVLKGIE